MSFAGLIFIGMGIFTLCGAYLDWEWFMTHPRAYLFTSAYGRNGARIAFGVLGGILVTLGGLLAFGVIE